MGRFLKYSWPQAILHVDGDSFFVSCEQVADPSLRGKPVVTGHERGIASAMSPEAKALGIYRAMPVFKIRKQFPECLIIPSNYELYSMMSVRMYEVVRRYSPKVEEYSIDECFADLTGQRRPLGGKSYKQIVQAVKQDLEHELGMSFSIGVAPTKTLAKVASNFEKPSGCTVIGGKEIPAYLAKIPVGDVWGIGLQSTAFLQGQRIHTALQFAEQSEDWIAGRAKPLREKWQELRGVVCNPINERRKEEQKSIQKTLTFSPASRDKERIFSELSKNIEAACKRARKYGLRAKKVSFFIKTQSFHFHGVTCVLDAATAAPEPLIAIARGKFDSFFEQGELYRSTGVTLFDLSSGAGQMDLFGSQVRVEEFEELHEIVDQVDEKFGKHTVFLGSSFDAIVRGSQRTERKRKPQRWQNKLKGETTHKRLNIPLAGEVD